MAMVLQIIMTVIGAFLSVILTKFLITNGRAIAENGRAIAENGKKTEEGFRLIARLIVEENEKTRKEILAML